MEEDRKQEKKPKKQRTQPAHKVRLGVLVLVEKFQRLERPHIFFELMWWAAKSRQLPTREDETLQRPHKETEQRFKGSSRCRECLMKIELS